MSENPFLNDQGYGPQSAADRIYAVERFDPEMIAAAKGFKASMIPVEDCE